jgi:histidyl-tRNA synthetase
MSTLDTAPYKGVRDFYPEEKFIQNHIFKVWRKTLESFGFVEYDASILEHAEIYKQKSGEEIINDQTFTFIDRGGREVTLRPEMTPTVARMASSKSKELGFPVKWYSIPNLFRYEAPQRGRLREHWQLNADILGVNNFEADIEILGVVFKLMDNFGAKQSDYQIKINFADLLPHYLERKFNVGTSGIKSIVKILDKIRKVPENVTQEKMVAILGEAKTEEFKEILSKGPDENYFEELGYKYCKKIQASLKDSGFNVSIDPFLTRGFDYYTGLIFEVYDTHSDNNRSLFGGGRYDDLADLFGKEKIPAIGFGAGDVTMKDFLVSHDLLPTLKSTTKLYVALTKIEHFFAASTLAMTLRNKGVNVEVDVSGKKLGDQIRTADRHKIPYIIVIGENEIKSKKFNLKNLDTGEEKEVTLEEIPECVK